MINYSWDLSDEDKKTFLDNAMTEFDKHGGGTKVEPEYTTKDPAKLKAGLQASFDQLHGPKYSKGDIVTIRTGTIEQICKYPDIGLTYYGVRMWEPWSKKFDLVFVEEKVLNKLMDISKIDKNVKSTTHIGDYK